jgi:hypothetical protein
VRPWEEWFKLDEQTQKDILNYNEAANYYEQLLRGLIDDRFSK